MTVKAEGPTNARIMIVGEAPGADEVRLGRPFVGYSGQLLDTMLADAGISRSECFITNVCQERPPCNKMDLWMPNTKRGQEDLLALGGREVLGRIVHPHVASGYETLQQDIEHVKPDLIIALGGTALWALASLNGISSWRGSTLLHESGAVLVPTFHPAAVLRQYSSRPIVVHDLRRAVATWKQGGIKRPDWNFLVRPTYSEVTHVLTDLLAQAKSGPLLLAGDIETRSQFTTCVGLAWTTTDAICIPLVSAEHPTGYYTEEEEAAIVYALYLLLTHPNVSLVGQNFIYDAQYFVRYWHFIPNLRHDTMLAQHVISPRMPKSLDFIASLHCEYYVYWKDDGKDWRSLGAGDEERYWRYNCEDCVRTLEAHYSQQAAIDKMGLRDVYNFQMSMWRPVLKMMIRGVDVDLTVMKKMRKELEDHAQTCLTEIEQMVGYKLNPRSPKQMQDFFYTQMGLPVQRSRATKGITCDDEALATLAKKEPIIAPIVQRIAEYRSCSTVKANALRSTAVGWDGRVHSSFNIAGAVTYRLSSSEDAFGSGMNLQNITRGDED